MERCSPQDLVAAFRLEHLRPDHALLVPRHALENSARDRSACLLTAALQLLRRLRTALHLRNAALQDASAIWSVVVHVHVVLLPCPPWSRHVQEIVSVSAAEELVLALVRMSICADAAEELGCPRRQSISLHLERLRSMAERLRVQQATATTKPVLEGPASVQLRLNLRDFG